MRITQHTSDQIPKTMTMTMAGKMATLGMTAATEVPVAMPAPAARPTTWYSGQLRAQARRKVPTL